jgi:hypothetical protein
MENRSPHTSQTRVIFERQGLLPSLSMFLSFGLLLVFTQTRWQLTNWQTFCDRRFAIGEDWHYKNHFGSKTCSFLPENLMFWYSLSTLTQFAKFGHLFRFQIPDIQLELWNLRSEILKTDRICFRFKIVWHT